jgi:ribosome-binding factor A
MSRRTERINEMLRERLSELLLREVRDPRLKGIVSVTSVEVSSDLREAKVFVSVLGTEEEMQNTLSGFQAAAGYLQRSLIGALDLRRVPHLVFMPDTSIREGVEMADLVRKALKEDEHLKQGGA